jgi:hypothetical protein
MAAGWAPRISQKPCFGARLSLSEMSEAGGNYCIDRSQFSACPVSTFAGRFRDEIRIFNVFLMSFLYYSGLMLVAGRMLDFCSKAS